MDIVVVGAGIIGAAVADRLAADGAAVTVIDAERPGSGTSGSSFAWLNSNEKLPRHYHDLSVRAIDAWARLAAGFGHPPWYAPTGNVIWTEAGGLSERLQRLREWDYPAEEITTRQLADLEPSLRPPATAQIASFPGEGFVHGKQAVDALLARARTAGARLIKAQAVVEPDAVRLPDGSRIPADAIVCCAGWRTARLLEPLGVDVPLVPPDAPGSTAPCLIVTTTGSAPVRRPVHTPGIGLRPAWGGGLRLEAGDINDVVDLHTPAAELEGYGRELVHRAAGVVDGFMAADSRSTLCVRPLPLDGHPVVGWLPELPKLYLAVTHSGITLAPELARLVTADILRNGGDELDPYRLVGRDRRGAR
ncbi:MAG TPA: FAD-dependent oxidoreductase [Actinoplanes sp.]